MIGTILNSRHKLDPEFLNIYQKLKNKNKCFAVAIGRQYANLLNNFNKVADEIFFIPENGSYLVKGGKELLKNTLEKRYVDEIIGLTRKINNARIVYCGCNKAYIENQDEEFMKVFRSYFDAYEIVDDLTKIDADCLKISICTINGLTSHDIIF